MQNRKLISCHLEPALQQQCMSQRGFLSSAPFVLMPSFLVCGTKTWGADTFGLLFWLFCVSNKLSKSKSGLLYLYVSYQLVTILGFPLWYMCAQPKPTQRRGNELTLLTENWIQVFKLNYDAFSLLITDCLPLFVIAFTLSSATRWTQGHPGSQNLYRK